MGPVLPDKCPRSFRSAPRIETPRSIALSEKILRLGTRMVTENHHFVFQLSTEPGALTERFNLHFNYSRSRTGHSVFSSDRSLQMKLRSSVILRSISSPGITTLLVMRSRESLRNWEYLSGYSVCEQGVHCMAYVIESVCVCKYWFEQQSAVLASCRIFLTDFSWNKLPKKRICTWMIDFS